jgi:hypothetical protein
MEVIKVRLHIYLEWTLSIQKVLIRLHSSAESKLAFAMTINKAQGQSLEHVGVYFPVPVFGRGQLYVALSRSGVPANTKLLIINLPGIQGTFPNKVGVYTKKVVYPEVFNV